jgi:hypothetical protein
MLPRITEADAYMSRRCYLCALTLLQTCLKLLPTCHHVAEISADDTAQMHSHCSAIVQPLLYICYESTAEDIQECCADTPTLFTRDLTNLR